MHRGTVIYTSIVKTNFIHIFIMIWKLGVWIFNNKIKRLYDILINVLKSHYSGMRMVAFLLHNICDGGTVYCNSTQI